jgi:hypothetical protein
MMRREAAYALSVEGIKNKDRDRQIEEREYGDGMDEQPG